MLQTTAPVHLSKFEHAIASGGEWRVQSNDWLVLQLCGGVAYALDSRANQELPLGGIVLCPPKSEINLTGSVLGPATFRGVAIRISSLTGFLTASERRCLETEVALHFVPFLSVPSQHPLATRLTRLLEPDEVMTLASRLGCAQAFADLVQGQLLLALNKGKETDKNQQDAKARLREFIENVPESELSNLSLGQLAKLLHCCERHTSRLFREEWGTGFLNYVTELRLKKACDLLMQGEMKIIDIALESGHGSLAHFNYVFKKKFHMTPTTWRKQKTSPPPPPRPLRRASRLKPLQMAAVVIWMIFSLAGLARLEAAEGPGGTNQPIVAVSTTNQPAGADAATNAPAKLTFDLDHYEARGNTLLPADLITRILAPFTGPALDFSRFTNDVANAKAVLQKEYFQRGYMTVKVTTPPQTVTNGFIILQVTEGKMAAVKIQHNRWFSSNNIMSALPYVKSLTSGERILNATVFQTELDRANANPDRQISPVLDAGPEPGTSVLVLDVKDRIPLHVRLEGDNFSPPGTPELRLNGNLSYGNLWQLDHTAGLQYGFSPEEMKPSIDKDTHLFYNPLDAPEVAYYSGFYRAPLGPPAGVEDQIAQDQTHFGYNETTKQFVLPPNLARPEFSAYASRSTTGPTIYGAETSVVNSSLLNIDQQLINQQYTSQTTAGGRLSFPLPNWEGIQGSWSFGLDYKEDKVVTLPTNYFYYTTRVSHGTGGGTTNTTQSSIAIPGTKTFPSLQYVPLFLGWSGYRRDHWGEFGATGDRSSQINGGLSLVAGTAGMFTKPTPFPTLIGNTPEATTEFVAVRPQLSRTQVLPDNFTFFGNLTGQWASEPLLNLEEFELGGNGSIRGYREGELYADNGWFGQAEFRSPVYWRGGGTKIGMQVTAFTDYGEGYELRQGASPSSQALWGTGAGLNFNFGPRVESHILIAWPLLNSAFTTAGHERISFSLSAQL